MRTIEWHDGVVSTIDQTLLPNEKVILSMKNYREVADAIKTMKIRGAPLLGAAAAYALALAAFNSKAGTAKQLSDDLQKAAQIVRATRPTAVNIAWALDRILDGVETVSGSLADLKDFVVREAQRIADEDVATNQSIGKHGAEILSDGDVVLTHCNAGALATVDYGTALGVIRAAVAQGKHIEVIAAETRPLLQGARLTAYELVRDGIPVTLITDGMSAYVMFKHMVNKVIVGADRIVRDALINKIGTYATAVCAKEHLIPFYVAAPKSTFDLAHTASQVIIEERDPREVTHIGDHRVAADGACVFNPSFDITPLDYVTGVICEDGILYKNDLDKLET